MLLATLDTVGDSAKEEIASEFLGKFGESGGVELNVESLRMTGMGMLTWLSSDATDTPLDMVTVGAWEALLIMLILQAGGGSCELLLSMLILRLLPICGDRPDTFLPTELWARLSIDSTLLLRVCWACTFGVPLPKIIIL